MKKSQVIIILTALGFILLIALVYFYWPHSESSAPLLSKPPVQTSAPIFMTSEEKASLFIPADKEVQIINRNVDGEILTYKIIKSDSDIVTPGKLFPLQGAEIK